MTPPQKTAFESLGNLPSIPKELPDPFVNGPMSAKATQDAPMAFKKALFRLALEGMLFAGRGAPHEPE